MSGVAGTAPLCYCTRHPSLQQDSKRLEANQAAAQWDFLDPGVQSCSMRGWPCCLICVVELVWSLTASELCS